MQIVCRPMVEYKMQEALTDSDDEYYGPERVYRQIHIDFSRPPVRETGYQQLAQLMLNSEPERKPFDDFEDGCELRYVPAPNLNGEVDSNINDK